MFLFFKVKALKVRNKDKEKVIAINFVLHNILFLDWSLGSWSAMKRLKCSGNENVFEIEEILTVILSRLPVKSLLICKSVCKSWRRFICRSSFMHLHLIQSQENPIYVCYSHTDDGVDNAKLREMVSKTDGETGESIYECDDGYWSNYFKGMICSFNGLICCLNSKECQINICNPATREVLAIMPPAPLKRPSRIIGVSFGPTINGYKIFQFLSIKKERILECMVYSSITRSWKSIGTTQNGPGFCSKHVCIDGIVYWLCESWTDIGIFAIDREEKFSIIRIPEVKDKEDVFMVNLEGCLCLVVLFRVQNELSSRRFDIWAMEDMKESVWVKKWSDYIPISKIFVVSRVHVLKSYILFGNCQDFAFYDMGTRSWREFKWEYSRGLSFECYYPVIYTESILPCKY